ncbi:MAG: ATP-dependent zinc metalloprotease FtsH [Fibrobacteres bacterium]|nr:ATP-dependent zinc metalloprotease FtsH [Fibrobacterota bacterium]
MPSPRDWFPVKEKEKPPEGGETGKPERSKGPANRNPPGSTGNRFLIWYLLGMVGIMLAARSLAPRMGDGMIPYSSFKEKLRAGEINKVEIGADLIVGMPKLKGTDPKSLAKAAPVRAVMPGEDASLIPMLDSLKVEYSARPEEGKGFLPMLLTWVFPALFFLGIWSFISKRAGGAAGAGLFSMGKSRAQVVEEGEVSTTFEDAAGVDEAKEELMEVIDFLKAPAKYLAIGGRVPKGVLLVGPPGTGKTLLARAAAGEAKVPFFRISGSDFVEMIVGVGAARVRDLFKQAREKAPCIVFIDELDAIGKSRSNSLSGHDEREQTLNQLLVEMDGFDPRVGVIILAATNRPETLDSALLRPGRFDRHILVDKPDLAGREAILKRHARGVKTEENIDLAAIARKTPGFVGADLSNVINEAALLAVKARREKVAQEDLDEAIEKVMAGLKKKNSLMTPQEKERVAHHETGHALVAAFTPGADPVEKISIIPRGLGALGFTWQLPTEERFLMTESQLLARIDVLLGGRAAEEISYGDVSTGAANDLGRATEIARQMIMEHGMNDRFRNMVLRGPKIGVGGGALPENFGPREFSESTQRYVDESIADILRERYAHANEILRARPELLEKVSRALLEKETLTQAEFQSLVRGNAEPDQGAPDREREAEAADAGWRSRH